MAFRALRAIAVLLALGASFPLHAGDVAGWPVTEGAPGGGRYSPLADITPENVRGLRVLWSYRHGDFFEGAWPASGRTARSCS